MADTINLPQIGQVKKTYVYLGVAAVAGLVGYAWYRRNQGGPAAPSDQQVDPLTGLPPATEDQLPTGYVNPRPVQSVIDDTTGGAPRNNQEWSAQVTELLGNLGYEPGHVAAVLGKFLAHLPLTADEGQLIQTAWAYAGRPPEGPSTISWASSTPAPGGGNPAPAPAPAPSPSPAPAPAPAPSTPRYVNTARFTSRNPPWNSTLSGIAAHEHTTIARLMQLNPQIHNANNIPYPGRIRVA